MSDSVKSYKTELTLDNGETVSDITTSDEAVAIYNDLNNGTTPFVRIGLSGVLRSMIIKITATEIDTRIRSSQNPETRNRINLGNRNNAF